MLVIFHLQLGIPSKHNSTNYVDFPSLLEWISKGNEQDSAKERNSCGSNFDGCKNLIPSGDRGKTHEAGEKGRRVGGGHVVGRLA
jgi:hypothetical protein